MAFSKKIRNFRWWHWLIILAFLSGYGGYITINKMTKHLVSPPRRALQDYHNSILANPDKYGIAISTRNLLQGKVPTLVVTSNGTVSQRGRILRDQLKKQRVSIPHLTDISVPHATIVLLHGRNGRKEDLLPIAERFCSLGFRCILPDLPSHGDSPLSICHYGSSDFETRLPKKVFLEVAKKEGFAKQPVHLWGISMGGSFLTHSAASNEAPWTSLTIIASFGSFQKVVSHKVPNLLHGFIEKKFEDHGGTRFNAINPEEVATQVDLPLLQFHGEQDDLIPINQGRQLFEGFQSAQKEFIVGPNANHDNILITPMKLYAKMATFMLTTQKTAAD